MDPQGHAAQTRQTARRRSLPVMCQHCAKPPCVDVCPTGASFKRADGIVLVDRHICIGCRYCMMACPYKARSFVHETLEDQKPHAPRGKGTVEGCTMCVQRVDAGGKPACVEACAQGGGRRDDVRRSQRSRQRNRQARCDLSRDAASAPTRMRSGRLLPGHFVTAPRHYRTRAYDETRNSRSAENASAKVAFRSSSDHSPFVLGPAWCCMSAVVAVGLGAAFYMEHHGHVVTGMNNQIVWGMPHVFAVFLIVAASGALNVASFSSVFGRSLYKPYRAAVRHPRDRAAGGRARRAGARSRAARPADRRHDHLQFQIDLRLEHLPLHRLHRASSPPICS